MTRNRMAGFALVVLSGLGGCTGIETNSKELAPPVGVGTGINELKRSPCACLEIPMNIPAALMS